MVTDHFVRRLSALHREILLNHIDGQVEIDRQSPGRGPSAVPLLIEHRLLKGVPQGTIRPRYTALTDDGRDAVAKILAGYADALVAAGLLEDPETGERPIEVLKRLKAQRRDPLAGALAAVMGLSGAADGQ